MARGNSSDDFIGMILALTLFLPVIIIVYLFKGIICLISFASNEKAKRKEEKIYKDLLNTNIQEQLARIDNLDGLQFEKYIGELLKKIGFKDVIVTKGSGDFGADIIAQKDNNKYAFQCKRFMSTIGPKPIGEVLRGMNKYKCNKGIVVTNNYFTNQAIQEAKVSNVELWDRDTISLLIGNNQIELVEKDEEEIIIEEKGANMEVETNQNVGISNINSKELIEHIEKLDNSSSQKGNKTYVDLTAGYYEVNEDIKEGKYIIEAISGNGILDVEDKEKFTKVHEWIGINNQWIRKYNNLKLKMGDRIKISNNVILRFSRLS